MRWPISSHTATLTITLSCRAFAIAASMIEFASASVTTCSVNASTNNRKEPSASQVPQQLHKLAALLRACLVPILRRHARNCRQRRGPRSRAGLGAGHVMDVAGRDQEADRAAFRIDPRVDLGGEASSALAHTTISTLFLARRRADGPARSSCQSSAPCSGSSLLAIV